MKYWVLKMKPMDDGVELSALPTGKIKPYRYKKGGELTEVHDKDMIIMYDSNYSDRVKLYDFCSNMDNVIIANAKVRDVLSNLEIKNVEYLPIKLQDVQGNISSEDYCIVNVLGGVDLIDMEKSQVRMKRLVKNSIDRIYSLVIDYDKISEDDKLFRASRKLDEFFISDEVKAAFEKAGLEGYQLYDAETWDGLNV